MGNQHKNSFTAWCQRRRLQPSRLHPPTSISWLRRESTRPQLLETLLERSTRLSWRRTPKTRQIWPTTKNPLRFRTPWVLRRNVTRCNLLRKIGRDETCTRPSRYYKLALASFAALPLSWCKRHQHFKCSVGREDFICVKNVVEFSILLGYDVSSEI